ncbi:autotransporter assembly complex protein TamA [Pelagibacterium lentulum]|uniref:Membrane protein n=1 Tax=Pelagibacterium lentulum TaxID=2029865 RepID=A0A916R605_9HYPH|nr:autotransporter assembly complex family protein [Pelagibacterium lentulum]GGA38375.1 membrane protein [Pelagibacterium lentulum]
MLLKTRNLLAGVALCLLATPVAGFELFGIQFFGGSAQEDAEAIIADPRTYNLSFETAADEQLDTALRSASNLWGDREAPASGVPGLLAKARGDYGRLIAALYNQGYYGGSVSIRVEGREASTLAPDTNLPEPANIAVMVNPGPQFRFGALDVANRAPADPTDDRMADLEDLGFQPGFVARATVITRAEQALIEDWRRRGYPKAQVARRDVVADHRTNALDVTIAIDPGAYAVIGDIGVSGAQNMDPDFIVRQTGLQPGQQYHPDDIALARSRLARLDVFRSLRLEQAEAVRADGTLPYTIFVQEQALRRFGVGATLSTLDGLGVEGFWLHRNLFGQAERLRVDAKVAGIGFPVETEEFDYAFGGTFTKPGILTPDTDLIARVYGQRSVLPLYEETTIGGQIGLSHLFTDTITTEGGFRAEHSYFVDDQFGERNFTTAGLYGSASFDTRDSQLDPTEGFFLSGSIDPVYEFEYSNAIVRATLEGRTYFGFGEDNNVVLAARVKAGAVAGPALSDIPPSMLFFAGGGGSVRGYGFRSIGVDDGMGGITGGLYLLEASAEARVRINETFGAVGFIDGGYVAADTFPDLEDLRLGAGIGLRYYTVLGPLRLDVAVPLNKRDDDGDYALYVGIGQAF